MTTTSGAESTVLAPESGALTALDDHALMAAVQEGSAEAFATFYARHKPGILSFCRHILGNREDAEDAVQHTFLAAYRHVQSEGPPAHPSAWLHTVARNRCLTMIRARHESPSDAIEPATAGLAEEVEWRFELRALLSDLSRLPEEQRAALILFELGGLDQTEIGEVLESSPDKVKALVYQARHGLMDRAVARETECREIRRRLSTLRGGKLNDRTLKHHLDGCAGCRAFRADVTLQRRGLALLLPVVPLPEAHASILGMLGIGGGAAAGGAAGASHSVANGHSHFGAHATATKVVAAGVAATAASAALALGLGGENPRRVVHETNAPPVTSPASPQPARSPVPRPAAAPRRKKRRPRAHPRPAAAPRRPAARVVAVVPPSPPAATPPARTQPRRPPRRSPASPPKSKPPPQPAPTEPVAPPAPVPTPEVTPTPVAPPEPPAAGDQGQAKHGHRNGPPGPIGNPQPHGPPPGWDQGKSPKR